MLSEAIHSAADTGNQVLLFLGLRRGSREADDKFHYGYGGERFVFGLLSAAGIFFVGCGVTLYHGVHALLEPKLPQVGPITFIVLGVAFVVEGSVLMLAVRTIAKQRGDISFFRYVREYADPATVAILLEDGAAVLGLVLAALGIVAGYLTANPLWDALATIVVGTLLGVVAIYLVLENRELLLGRAVPEGVEDRFVAILRKHAGVREVRDVKTRQLTPEAYKLKAEIALDENHLAGHLAEVVPAALERLDPRDRETVLRELAARAIVAVSAQIAALERTVKREIPQARHIDLEVAPESDRGSSSSAVRS
jgi:zinc transporter 9